MLIRASSRQRLWTGCLVTVPSTMPVSFTAFRALSGTFYWTYISFMAKREQVLLSGSAFKVVKFVPLRGGYQSSQCLHIRTDCALFYFTYLTHSYSDNTSLQKKTRRCGKQTAAFVVVFLARFLMQCMDVESNPGPGSKYNWEGGSNSLQREGRPQDAPRHNQHSSTAPNQTPLADLTDFLAAAIKKIESSQTQLEEKIGRRLRQVDQDQADLANGTCTLTEQHRSLQAENESLKEDVKYLSARCESLQQYCENLYDWQDQLSSATRELDDHLDRLDAFSRKNSLRFFNVHEVRVKTTSRARGKSSSYSIASFLLRHGNPRTSSRLIALDRNGKTAATHARWSHVSTHGRISCPS